MSPAASSPSRPQVSTTNSLLHVTLSDLQRSSLLLWLAQVWIEEVYELLRAQVDDPPSAKSDRARIETGTISLLSTLDPTASDRPSAGWLGHHADRESIRGSGLWNVNHVRATKDPGSLEVLEHHLAQFGGR